MHFDSRAILAAGAFAAVALLPNLASGEETLPVVTYTPIDLGACADARPSGFRGTSAILACSCPAGPASGSVWGTDIYTDDSAICAAARHRGVIGSRGGTVTLEILAGRQSYFGSIRNGVDSGDYGSWSGSYRFVAVGGEGAAAVAEAAVEAATTDGGTCDSAATWRGRASRLTCTCPANANNSRSVWGTDTYTDDSYICKAALHAGVLTRNGGRVTIELLAGRSSYKGSNRNGVSTSDYGSWGGSFRFVQ